MGALALGRNLTPFPRPIPGGHLITRGIYGIVRHPLYMAGIFATLGWSLLAANLIDIGLVAVVFLFFDLKETNTMDLLVGRLKRDELSCIYYLYYPKMVI
jgi:protein-S-isoprenylcysteine O-methyltransferase Ste14